MKLTLALTAGGIAFLTVSTTTATPIPAPASDPASRVSRWSLESIHGAVDNAFWPPSLHHSPITRPIQNPIASTIRVSASTVFPSSSPAATPAVELSLRNAGSNQAFLDRPPPRGLSAQNPDDLLPAVMELNGFFASKRIQMGDLCERTAEEGEDKRVGGSRNSICVGTKVAYCDNQSRRWEEDRDCEIPGYVCGAVRQKCTVYGGWKLGITCVRPDNFD